jgi:hypothetical protein
VLKQRTWISNIKILKKLWAYFTTNLYLLLYVAYHSGLFVDQDDSELWFRLDYKYMDIHENSYQGFGKDFAYHVFVIDKSLLLRQVLIYCLSQIADEFNEIQANDLYHRVSKKIKGNLSDSDSDHPFPIRYRMHNVLDYPEDYLDESK